MAIIQSPWLGRSRNKLGGAVTYTSDGRVIARSMPASVKNPRTVNQIITRVILSTASKAYSKLQGIVDHSFEGYREGAKNQQRFIKVNTSHLRSAYRTAQQAGRDIGNYNKKDVMASLVNLYVVSEGTLPTVLYALALGQQGNGSIQLTGLTISDTIGSETTYAQVCEQLGLPVGAQLTFGYLIGAKDGAEINRVKVARCILEPANGDASTAFISDGVLQSPNAKNEMAQVEFELVDGVLGVGYLGVNTSIESVKGVYVIASVYENEKWRRSTQQIYMDANLQSEDTMREAIESWATATDVSSPLYLNQGVADNVEGV